MKDTGEGKRKLSSEKVVELWMDNISVSADLEMENFSGAFIDVVASPGERVFNIPDVMDELVMLDDNTGMRAR